MARCQGCVKGTWPVQDMAFAHIGPGYDCAYWKVASVCAWSSINLDIFKNTSIYKTWFSIMLEIKLDT